MTHDELLAKVRNYKDAGFGSLIALGAVVELHKPIFYPDNPDSPVWCYQCAEGRGYAKYPCPTIQAIEEAIARGQK